MNVVIKREGELLAVTLVSGAVGVWHSNSRRVPQNSPDT
jgi:hypothetical protein